MTAEEHLGQGRLLACPLCGSSNIATYDTVASIDRCRSCGYVYDNPRPSPEDLAAFYSRPSKYGDWLARLDARERMWRRRLAKMEPIARPGRLLDVGAGIGQFLSIAKPHFEAVEGTEVSSEAVEVAEDRFGLSLHHGDLHDLDLDAGSFDDVTLFHVLEHVHDPRALVRRCHDLLCDGGVIFIAVPNDRLFVTRLRSMVAAYGRGGRSRRAAARRSVGRTGLSKISLDGEFAEIHLSHFTPGVLRALVASEGFTPLELSCDPFFAAGGAAERVHAVAYALGSWLNRKVRVNLYPTIWLAARKGVRVPSRSRLHRDLRRIGFGSRGRDHQAASEG